MAMLVTTTNTVEGKRVVRYLGLVSGEAIMGANILKDIFAGIRDIVGGRSEAYEQELSKAKTIALDEMQAGRRSWAPTPLLRLTWIMKQSAHTAAC